MSDPSQVLRLAADLAAKNPDVDPVQVERLGHVMTPNELKAVNDAIDCFGLEVTNMTGSKNLPYIFVRPSNGRKLAATQATPAPLRFHPKMAETYRDRVGTLIQGLG